MDPCKTKVYAKKMKSGSNKTLLLIVKSGTAQINFTYCL